MVQLGIEAGKEGILNKIRNFFVHREKSWDIAWLRENRERMVRIFLAAVEQYNLSAANREVVDKNGVYIAEQMIAPEGYKLLVGYHQDVLTDKEEYVGYDGVYERQINTTVYTNLLIAYNWRTMRIMIVQVNADLTNYSNIYVFSKENILKAKYSWFSDMFQIYDKGDNLVENLVTYLSSKNRTTFVINGETDEKLRDGDGCLILVYMRQVEDKADFVKFFKEFSRQIV